MYTLIKWTNQGTTSLTRTATFINCTARSIIPSVGNSQFITSTSLGETNKQTKLYIHVHVLLIYTWKTEDTFQVWNQIFSFKKGEAGGDETTLGVRWKFGIYFMFTRVLKAYLHTQKIDEIYVINCFSGPPPLFSVFALFHNIFFYYFSELQASYLHPLCMHQCIPRTGATLLVRTVWYHIHCIEK